mmetsp:Transcript_35548/g.85775  ORF Transcript_35548/g.85775 Transcript_35548/m.85775 type:complete len:231 (-) Transcript_35548:354-1046(-)
MILDWMEVKRSRMTRTGIIAERDFVIHREGRHLDGGIGTQAPDLYVLAETPDGYRIAELGGKLCEHKLAAWARLETLDDTPTGTLLDEIGIQRPGVDAKDFRGQKVLQLGLVVLILQQILIGPARSLARILCHRLNRRSRANRFLRRLRGPVTGDRLDQQIISIARELVSASENEVHAPVQRDLLTTPPSADELALVQLEEQLISHLRGEDEVRFGRVEANVPHALGICG